MVTVAIENLDELSILNFAETNETTQYLKLKSSKGAGCKMVMDVILDLDRVVENPFGKSIKVTVVDAQKYVEGFEPVCTSIKEHYEFDECKFPFGKDGSFWLKMKNEISLPDEVEVGTIMKAEVDFGVFVNSDSSGMFCTLKNLSLPKLKAPKKKSKKE